MNTAVNTTIALPGYHLVELLYCGARTVVYRGIRLVDDQPVVVKLLQLDYPTFHDLLQFRNQYAIAKNLDIPGIVRPYSLEPYRNSYALVMEDFGGVSLRDYTGDRRVAICRRHADANAQVLEIALQVADVLHQLHQNRVIHKDIKPANILIHPETKQVKLIDFSIASLLPKETQEIKNPNILEGTLAYLAPEQTGRMNRGIDYRSDFYALGVTLFELLTGQLPFESEDPMELVHCHIAKQPPSLGNREEIPSVLADMVMKLMAKNAEERYQSALGLKYDLEICLHQLKEKGEIEAFEIGQRDVCDRFNIPEKLYGRETEVKTLLDAFERVSKGKSELMLVAGFSGIGKTAVINEVHKPIVRQRGYFIKGKFDQFNRNIPFSAFVQAFRDLMGQLLGESDAQLATWKTKILQALGDNAQVIIEVIPELELIIGQQPPVPQLSGSAAQNRFNLLFQKFIKVFTTKEHPLVIFLDDLQWTDSASLNLLKLLISEVNSGYLLILGAYRDNEVFPAHPLMLTLEEIHKCKSIVNTITLAPLSESTVNQLVADTLSCTPELAQTLTQLVYQKTKGNPFFTTQFLKALYEEELITFNHNHRYWECDIAQVNTLSLTDDVVEFIALQLQKLPDETQQVLKLAACIGNQFDLATLALVSEQSPLDAATTLWKALQEGLILPTSQIYKFFQDAEQVDVQSAINPIYRFLHDRVQQAAYSLIPDQQKTATHLKIGQLIFHSISPAKQQERIFEIINHLNVAANLITTSDERQELAQLNLSAALKAQASAAYQAAMEYSIFGIELLDHNCWKSNYDLTLALHDRAATNAYLCCDFNVLEELAHTILENAKTLLDKMKVYEVKIQTYMAQSQLMEAIALGLQILALLGVHLPFIPTPQDVQTALTQTAQVIEGKNVERLVDLPILSDRHKLAIINFLGQMGSPAYQTSANLFVLVICQQVILSVTEGNSPSSAYAYVSYGIILSAVLNQIELGYQFGLVAVNLQNKFRASAFESQVLFVFAATILYLKNHVRETLPLLEKADESGRENGGIQYAGYAMMQKVQHGYLMGKELSQIAEEVAIKNQVLAQLKQKNSANWNQTFGQAIVNLTGVSGKPYFLREKVEDYGKGGYEEDHLLSELLKQKDRTGLHYFYFNKMILAYLFDELDLALEYALKAGEYLDGVTGFLCVSVYYFYDALISLATWQRATKHLDDQFSEVVSNLSVKVQVNQVKIKEWADYAPMNYLHKWYLVEAEWQWVLGNKSEAIDLYDRAIAGAKENGYIQEEALANELAAKFYLDWGKEKVAAGYMQEAYYCYAKWGALAKINDLEKRYPQLLLPILQQAAQPLTVLETLASISTSSYSIHSTRSHSSSSTSLNNTLDFAALLKVSQAMSSTIQLDDLIQTLTQTMLENSGADKCALVLCQDGTWQVRAIADLQQTTLQTVPLEDNPTLPVQLINYVKNTLETIVLDNLKTDLLVAINPYLEEYQPKSVLCLPILNQGNLAGILYLENRATSGVFTSDRLVVLNFLCNQAAISLENAKLHAQEREKSYHLEQSQRRLKLLLQQTPVAVIEWNTNFEIQFWNRAAEKVFGYRAEDVLGQHFRCIIPEEYHAYVDDVAAEILAQRGGMHAINENITKDGRRIICEWFNAPMFDANGEVSGGVSMSLDITDRQTAEMAIQQKSQELEQALQELQQAQLQIVQSEKMSALGNLVAGVAHEINNPIGCIVGNVGAAQDYINDLLGIIDLYQEEIPQASAKIEDELEAIDLEYVREDLPKLIKAMKDGGDRIKSISKSLRTFSRADSDTKQKFNLHEGIDSTILILRHRLKANESRPAIEVITDYGNLPEIACFPGQLNQVFMNILANAIDALDESNTGRSFAEIKANYNRITIQTNVEDGQVKIAIADNGKGIPEELKSRIFDHLFTTKGVGKGTGLGLAIARQIVEEKHQGRIAVNSTLGLGTEFAISLPIEALA